MLNNRKLRPDGSAGGNGEPSGETDDPIESRIATAEAIAANAVARYRQAIASGPNLVAEMVQGSTVEEIDISAEAARKAYSDISRRLVEQYEREVPPGNPARSSTTSGAEYLKPEAKIALGLRRAER